MNEILVKYLLGESSADEDRMVKSWLAESPQNEKYYNHFRIIWEESKKMEPQIGLDEHTAWERFQLYVQKKEEEKQAKPRQRKPGVIYLRIIAAACLFIIIGIAAYFYFPGSGEIASGNKILVKKLPDNTVVTLNKNAKLIYGKSFNKEDREVRLYGEAFFDVTPDKQRPFRIIVNDVLVTVVGTSFNVKSSAGNTEVIVETGLVSVRLKDKEIRLSPHQKVRITSSSDQLVVQPNEDELYNYYRTGRFICNNTSLRDLVAVLNQSYNTHIRIADEKVAELRLTTVFDKESLSGILDIISQTLDVTVEHNNSGEFVIK